MVTFKFQLPLPSGDDKDLHQSAIYAPVDSQFLLFVKTDTAVSPFLHITKRIWLSLC